MAKKTSKQPEAAQEQQSATVEQLQHELEQSKQAQAELTLQAQRSLADYANLKKRFEKEREELSKFAGELALMRLLPAVDNLQRAVAYATEEDQRTSIYQGVKLTLQQIDEALGQMGLKRMTVSAGDAFDPQIHEAVETVPGSVGQVVDIVEAGYAMHDKVVRPAKVKVGSG